ncbi:MAG: hypothetical protein E7183_08420 [Erysipelotrichaceae bacterium]|nr:hypothetical protein [Erysipelotrichaceae bacterium]
MKKIIIFTFIFLLTNFLIIINSLDVSAHSTLLTVKYDECLPEGTTDGEDKVWYYLCETNYSRGPIFDYYHIGQDISTIKYFFEDAALNGSGYTWTTDIDEELANEIKAAYVESMMKWNDVYYYSYDNNGNRIANKLINIEEGTEDDHNLSIYPLEHYFTAPIASTGNMHDGESITTNITNITHRHISDFYMNVNIKYFYRDDTNKLVTDEQLKVVRERTGMHEVGHILGLDDVDACCTKRITHGEHHNEILMGYGVLEDRQDNVTYKDIAGISIIREFHTDADHIWMKRTNNDGTIDLICAQCNGVLYDIDMDSNDITYQGQHVNIYWACKHHEGTISNMLLVATDGERNFFKCQNCRHIETIEISEEYSLSNYSSTINKTVNLSSNETKYYKINSNYNKYYEFMVDGTYGVDIKLFDENFNEILIADLNDSNSIEHIINQLQVGTYYLEIKNSSSSTNLTSIKIVSRTTAYIGVGDNDVLLNTHNYNDGIYPTNYYYYINSRGVGFYRFTLTGVKTDGTTVTYPYSSIMIKDHMNEDVMDKYSLTGYSNQAISGYNENTFVAYLNATGYFYVYIDIDTDGLKSLTLNIEPVEYETIDLFAKSETINSTMEILDSETTKGDYTKKVNLKQAGKFTIDYSYSGTQSNDILFVLSKLNYNSTTQKYTIETLISQLMDGTNDSFTYTLNLTEGTYFISYFNKDDNAAFDVTFNRLVTQYGGSVLIPDPDAVTDGGSQVNIYEKALLPNDRSYRGTNIVIGFTRVIYIDYHYVDQYSREDYYWYSSNDSIATVSQHGTVFGKSVGTVKIMAVNKDNPSIVFVKQFTVVHDTKTYSEVVYSEFSDTHKLSNGEYQLGLDVQNSLYPMAQYYSWRVVSKSSTITSVSIDAWGNVTITGIGSVVIEGYNYIYNDNYGVRINLTVTN